MSIAGIDFYTGALVPIASGETKALGTALVPVANIIAALSSGGIPNVSVNGVELHSNGAVTLNPPTFQPFDNSSNLFAAITDAIRRGDALQNGSTAIRATAYATHERRQLNPDPRSERSLITFTFRFESQDATDPINFVTQTGQLSGIRQGIELRDTPTHVQVGDQQLPIGGLTPSVAEQAYVTIASQYPAANLTSGWLWLALGSDTLPNSQIPTLADGEQISSNSGEQVNIQRVIPFAFRGTPANVGVASLTSFKSRNLFSANVQLEIDVTRGTLNERVVIGSLFAGDEDPRRLSFGRKGDDSVTSTEVVF